MGWIENICRRTENCGRTLGLVFLVLSLSLGACGGEETIYRDLHLWITSEAPSSDSRIDRLVMIVRDASPTGHPMGFDGASEAEHRKEITLGAEYNIYEEAYKTKLISGDSIMGSVVLFVYGMSGQTHVSTWVGNANLDSDARKEIRLLLVPDGCDQDEDGTLDCAKDPACCEGLSSVISDCDDDNPGVSPLVVLGGCKSCTLALDSNCDGIEEPCVDADEDGHEDCDSSVDCDPSDPDVHVDADEVCDGKDNNCNQQTDEGVQTQCKYYDVAKLCESFFVCGECPDPVPDEICSDGLDNNCDGLTDEDCSSEMDWDGDGFVEADCNNYDAKIYEGSPYNGCCDPALTNGNLSADILLYLCDFDCSNAIENDEWCPEGDNDLDGYVDSEECGPGDPTVYPNAPEICGDGKDNDCFGGDKSCDDVVDGDGDGYSPPEDCDDNDENINPGANEMCNGKDDNCNGFVDEGNPGDGVENGPHRCISPEKPNGVCAEEKNYGFTVCVVKGSSTVNPGVQCVDYYEPDLDYEIACDGKDNDCDGDTDEDFEVLTLDGKTVKNGIGEICGSGVCAGSLTKCNDFGDGIVCPNESNSADEICDGKDNDCDGLVDAADPESLLTYDTRDCEQQAGVCAGSTKPANLCTNGAWQPCPTDVYLAHDDAYEAGSEFSCDGLDNDCDDDVDDDFSMTTKANATITGGIGESCGTGLCAGGVTQCNAAGDGIECPTETGVGSQVSDEVCDALDNDCDGKTDSMDPSDLLSNDQQLCEKQQGECVNSTKPASLCQGGVWKTCTNTVYKAHNGSYQANKETSCDDKDNDCDGEVDDDFSLTLLNGATVTGVGTACGTGSCLGGKTLCASTSTLTCSTENQAVQDLCDNVDNDCDGQTDEGLNSSSPDAGNTCNLVKGVCNPSTVIAVCANGKYTCDYTSQNPDYEAPEDSCDGKDNDCDGLIDQADSSVQPPDICDKDGVCGQLSAATCLGAADWDCVYTDLNQPGQLPIYTDNENKANGAWCDNQDNDCDGQVDETYAAKGKPCTRGVGQCQNTGEQICKSDQTGLQCSVTGQPAGTECDDQNAQTQNDACTGGDTSKCQGDTFTCEDDSLSCTTLKYNGDGTCTQQVNAGTCLIDGVCYLQSDTNALNECQWCNNNPTAWQNKPSSASCNDGDNCTENDYCLSGTCVAGTTYECSDGLSCTADSCGPGFEQCINDLIDGNCLIGSVCYSDNAPHAGGNPCLKCTSGISPITWSNVSNGTECIDGKKCTVTSECQNGSCVVQLPVDCDDTNPCTTDSCSESAPGTGCIYEDVTAGQACNDGDLCTENTACNGSGSCTGGTATSCDDGNDCTDDSCTSETGCVNVVDMANTCDDGSACTDNDVCLASGQCEGADISCDDQNECTNDTCDPLQGCQYENNSNPCSDGLFCNGEDKCSGGTCSLHEGDPCAASLQDGDSNCSEACNETANACTAVEPDASACSDGDSCSVNDTCSAGVCIAGAPYTGCFDGKTCTDDVCVGTGVVPTCTFPVTIGCLIDGVCRIPSESHPSKTCQECNGSLDDTGWSNKSNGTFCNDGAICTNPDVCTNGECVGTDTCPPGEECNLKGNQCV